MRIASVCSLFAINLYKAKQALYELILDTFSTERKKYNHYMNNLNELDEALAIGAKKAKKVAGQVLQRVRSKIGY